MNSLKPKNIKSIEEVDTDVAKAVTAEENRETASKHIVSKAKLLEAGTYFGHKKSVWNPKMKDYIHSRRGNTHILDWEKTLLALNFAYDWIYRIAKKNASFIFVGTRKPAAATIKENALRANSHYVYIRWLGGTLTNHSNILSRVKTLLKLERIRDTGFAGYTKKEAIEFSKHLAKLERNLEGIRNMRQKPHVMIVADPLHDIIAVKEARKMGVKIIGIVDSNADPSLVDITIPANDDSKKSITLIITLLADAIAVAKGGEAKFAFRPDEDIVLPVEPKKIRRPRNFSDNQMRLRRNSRFEQRTSERDKERADREAKAGQAQISSMDDLEALTVAQLKDKAKQKEIKNYSTMHKKDLINALKE